MVAKRSLLSTFASVLTDLIKTQLQFILDFNLV